MTDDLEAGESPTLREDGVDDFDGLRAAINRGLITFDEDERTHPHGPDLSQTSHLEREVRKWVATRELVVPSPQPADADDEESGWDDGRS